MNALCRGVLLVLWVIFLCVGGAVADAQTLFYTHTSGPPGGDGFLWDEEPGSLNDLFDGNTYITPDGVNYGNFSGNTTFFDDNYLAAGNSSVINGDAWWGNPSDDVFAQVELGFFNTENSGVDTVSFDVAWAIAGQNASDFIEFEVLGYGADGPDEGDLLSTFVFDTLPNTFNAGGAFGGFQGAEGSFSFDVNNLFDDNSGEAFTIIDDIFITVADVATLGGTGEFAIDNVSVNGGGSTVDGSNVFPSVNSGSVDVSDSTLVTSVLQNTGVIDLNLSVTNDGTDAATFTTSVVPGGDLTPGSQATNQLINAGQTIFNVSSSTLDSNTASADYRSDILVQNDNNAADPDDTTTISVRVHEPPSLTANNGSPLQVDVTPTLTLDNAQEAVVGTTFRAGVKVDSFGATGPFRLTNIAIDDQALPGGGVTADVEFNRYGEISGPKNGTALIGTTMVSQTGFFLRNAQPVPDENWNLAFNHTDVPSDSRVVALGENYDEKVGVNSDLSAATLVDGESPSSQTVSMTIVPDSGTNATLASDAVDLDFTAANDLYVLQFTYDPAQLPVGVNAGDLRLLLLDEGTNLWGEAILDNGDGGAGGSLFLGSYSDYLGGSGGGSLDNSDISDFGIDTTNNHVWAILDHASTFALGVLQAGLTGDYNGNGVVDAADYTVWRDTLGGVGVGLSADGDLDGDVDFDDYYTWVARFGDTLAPASAIPEPASGLLAVAALLAAITGRPQQR